MVLINPAIDDAADSLVRAPRAELPVANPNNNIDPAAALSHFDVVHGTTATADVGAGTTAPLWNSPPPPYYPGSSDAYASSSFPLPPLQSNDNDLACYAGFSIDDASFPQLPPAPPMYMQPEEELSYFYYYPDPQPQQGFPPCFAAAAASSFALEPEPATTTIRPELQLQAPAAAPSLQQYPQTLATATGSASVEREEASPALAATQQQAQQDDDTANNRPAPRRRRGRPSKRALAAVSETTTNRVAVGSNRAAPSSHKTSSAAATGSATMSSAAGHQVPPYDQAGTSRSSTGGTSSGQQQTAACTSTDDDGAAPAGVEVVEGHDDHQQHAAAAIAPPPPELTTTTTGASSSYADTSPTGVRFHPKHHELINYLRMKYAGQQIPVDFITEFDVYQAHPMAIRDACGESQDGCWYAFSPRDRKYRNGQRPARSVFAEGGGGGQRKQVGFWKSNSKLAEICGERGAVIGKMAKLTFHVGQQPKGEQTGWKMKEYTIPENQRQADGSAMLLNDWVLCMVYYKEQPTCTTTDTESETEDEEDAISVGQEPPMHGESEKGKNNGISVGQKRPRRSRKSKKDKNNGIPPAVEQDDEPAAAGETVDHLNRTAAAQQGEEDIQEQQGEEDMQEMMVPAAHQQQQEASDYFEQDLFLEDFLLSDLEFAQQNDAATNCTI